MLVSNNLLKIICYKSQLINTLRLLKILEITYGLLDLIP